MRTQSSGTADRVADVRDGAEYAPFGLLEALLLAAVTAALLLAGDLQALQQATIVVALPFVVVMLALTAALVKEMAADPADGIRRRHSRPHGLGDAVRTVRSDPAVERAA